jgi:hypothetical protein
MESFDMLHEEDHRQHNDQKKKGQTTIYKTLHKNQNKIAARTPLKTGG